MKTVYERFLEANTRLWECYEAVAPSSWEEMGAGEKRDVCKDERESITEFLSGNEIKFANLIKERLDIVKDL